MKTIGAVGFSVCKGSSKFLRNHIIYINQVTETNSFKSEILKNPLLFNNIKISGCEAYFNKFALRWSGPSKVCNGLSHIKYEPRTNSIVGRALGTSRMPRVVSYTSVQPMRPPHGSLCLPQYRDLEYMPHCSKRF